MKRNKSQNKQVKKAVDAATKLQGIWKDLPKSVVKELLKKSY
jgi:hypothetical protein